MSTSVKVLRLYLHEPNEKLQFVMVDPVGKGLFLQKKLRTTVCIIRAPRHHLIVLHE